MILLAHHEWSLPLIWALLGGGGAATLLWLKSKFWGHRHTHTDGTTHTHPHEHEHDDHTH